MPSQGTFHPVPNIVFLGKNFGDADFNALNAAPSIDFGGAIGTRRGILLVGQLQVAAELEWVQIQTKTPFKKGAATDFLEIVVQENVGSDPVSGGVVDSFLTDGAANKVFQSTPNPLIFTSERRRIWLTLASNTADLDQGIGVIRVRWNNFVSAP